MNNPNTDEIVAAMNRCCESEDEILIMEVCGTHTVSLFRSGIRSILPPQVILKSGPGCPVCVTPQGHIDLLGEVSLKPGVTICTYGDMLRVPGRTGSLQEHRAKGARIKVCYSIMDGLRHAENNPDEQVIFAAIGFETTAPATALAIQEAQRKDIRNFFILNSHKRVMPALRALLNTGDLNIHGFLLPGHVSVIIGSEIYMELVDKYGMASVVAGFETGQLLAGISSLLEQVSSRSPRLENVYNVVVDPKGNERALACINEVFVPCDTQWRAMGVIPKSGLALRAPFKRFDAIERFNLEIADDYDPPGCKCGDVIQGKLNPDECPLFGERCTFEKPIGPCMVSSEGSCAAWFRYGAVAKQNKHAKSTNQQGY